MNDRESDSVGDEQPKIAQTFNLTSIGAHLVRYYSLFIFQLAETLEHIFISAAVYGIVCLLIYFLIFRSWASRCCRWLVSRRFPACKRVLFVTAHPDDESMFFGPTIRSLAHSGCQLYLLCLSNGNFEHKGRTRTRELWDACRVLKIPAENITVVNASQLQDDPAVTWKPIIIAKQIMKQVHSLDIDTIVTFDRDGVSHHANHCAVYYASISVFVSNLLPEGCRLFTLDSVNVCRKYTFLFDLVLSIASSKYWYVLSWSDYRSVVNAMAEHRSQMLWFRRLYVLFSRYMIINTLREVTVSDAELEMQISSIKNS